MRKKLIKILQFIRLKWNYKTSYNLMVMIQNEEDIFLHVTIVGYLP